jgi:ABC-type sugar transport system ATPase subunit
MINSAGEQSIPVLEVKAVQRSFGHVRALDCANLKVMPGEIHALLGDNGAGKSTMIKIISGVLAAQGGQVLLDGQEVHFKSPHEARMRGIETVYQDLALAHTLNAGENIFLGSEIMTRGLLGKLGFIDREEMSRQAAETLSSLGINLPAGSGCVGTLSGGQMQAVAIARAIKWGRRLLILDEPTAALGAKQRELILQMIEHIRDARKLTVLLISHNLPDVFRVADKVTVLRLGQDVLTSSIEGLTTDSLMRAMTGANEICTDKKGGAH